MDPRQSPRGGSGGPPIDPVSGPDPAAAMTARQREQVRRRCAELRTAAQWHGGLPVLLLERCWLRLETVAIEQLAQRLPPDGSWDAPELVHYRSLLRQGHPPAVAEQLCWLEFGPEACHEAQRRLWKAQEEGRQAWTLQRYLDLLQDYRRRFARPDTRALPLLVLARAGEPGSDAHSLHWLSVDRGDPVRPMRHTCA